MAYICCYKIVKIMGTYTYFKPTEEKVNSLREEVSRYDKNRYDFLIKPEKELMYVVLKTPKREDDYKGIYFSIKYKLMEIMDNLKKEQKRNILKDIDESKDGEFYYCSMNVHNSYCPFEKETLIEDTIDNLVILNAIVSHPDYFDDKDKFYDLKNDIVEEIEGFIECANDVVICEIEEEYREFRVPEPTNDELYEQLTRTVSIEKLNDLYDGDNTGKNPVNPEDTLKGFDTK